MEDTVQACWMAATATASMVVVSVIVMVMVLILLVVIVVVMTYIDYEGVDIRFIMRIAVFNSLVMILNVFGRIYL